MRTTSPNTVEKNTQPAWLTVAIREVLVKVTDKAFIISTVVTLAMMIIGIVVASYFAFKPYQATIAVADATAEQAAEQVRAMIVAADEEAEVTITRVPSDAEARLLVTDKEADIYLHHEESWVLSYYDEADPTFEKHFQDLLNTRTVADLAAQAGVDPTSMQSRMSFGNELLIDPESDSAAFDPAIYAASMAFAVLFMVSALVYGLQIATSVIEEKQSRIVEILVAAIPVRALLTGKIVGNTLMAFVQMLLFVAVSLVGVATTPLSTALPHIGPALVWYLVFFVVGFLALACVWAAAGALGTRNEDLQYTSQPLTWILMAVYIAGLMASGTLRTALSYVPIVSSVLMPVRVIAGTAQWWEPVVAIGLTIIFAIVMILFGERIYRRALLQTHARLSYRQALKLTE